MKPPPPAAAATACQQSEPSAGWRDYERTKFWMHHTPHLIAGIIIAQWKIWVLCRVICILGNLDNSWIQPYTCFENKNPKSPPLFTWSPLLLVFREKIFPRENQINTIMAFEDMHLGPCWSTLCCRLVLYSKDYAIRAQYLILREGPLEQSLMNFLPGNWGDIQYGLSITDVCATNFHVFWLRP